MIFNMVGGGGIARTPIVVITSETELPANPKPGTIAILTTTSIGRIYAQATIPESPSVGDLWFAPSAVANVVYIDGKEAYAVKTVKQYNGTAWETVNAFQYTDGAWSTMVYLLNGIDECKPITGGWKAIAIRRASNWTDDETQAPVVTKIDGGVTLTQSASGYKSGAYRTKQKIDVSGYDLLRIRGEVVVKDRSEVRLVSAVGPYSESNTVLYEELPSSGAIDITMDVSGLTGDYYVLFDIATDGDTSTIFTLTKIWLDKVKYLFDNGDQYEAVTGGWGKTGEGSPSFTVNADRLTVSKSASSNGRHNITTYNMIDLTNVSAIEFEANCTNPDRGQLVVLSSAIKHVASKSTNSASRKSYTLDVSALEGEYYIAFGVIFNESGTWTANLYRAKLIY